MSDDILAIVGPRCAGKSTLAPELVREIGDCKVINVDEEMIHFLRGGIKGFLVRNKGDWGKYIDIMYRGLVQS
ncbi:MAG: hypothetical protein V1725_05895 [archaeon]